MTVEFDPSDFFVIFARACTRISLIKCLVTLQFLTMPRGW